MESCARVERNKKYYLRAKHEPDASQRALMHIRRRITNTQAGASQIVPTPSSLAFAARLVRLTLSTQNVVTAPGTRS
jgi:hypothetical protein